MTRRRSSGFWGILMCAVIFLPHASVADEALKNTSPANGAAVPQKLDVDALKQKYWAKGDQRELEVVQNRIYTKAHKLNLELNAGIYTANPFVNTTAYGGLLGFYFNEYIGIDFQYWKMSSSPSSALTTLEAVVQNGNGANANNLTSLMGGELTASLLYGKLSLVGKAIIHFDLMARAGVGVLSLATTTTTYTPQITQTAIAPWIGIGQQFYLTRWLALHVDWRLMFYSEKIYEQFNPNGPLGNLNSTNSTLGSLVTGGLSVLLF